MEDAAARAAVEAAITPESEEAAIKRLLPALLRRYAHRENAASLAIQALYRRGFSGEKVFELVRAAFPEEEAPEAWT